MPTYLQLSSDLKRLYRTTVKNAARARVGGKTRRIGTFHSEDEALRAYYDAKGIAGYGTGDGTRNELQVAEREGFEPSAGV